MAEDLPPYALQAFTAHHGAKLFRRVLAALGQEGVTGFNGSNDMKVSAQGSPNMSVVVARGGALVKGDDTQDQGLYFVYNNANETVNITTADATNPRIDLIVAHVYDASEGQAGDMWQLEAVAGTPAGVPAVPAVPDTAVVLAQIAVAAGATAINSGNITDKRASATAFHSASIAKSAAQNVATGSDIDVTFGATDDYDTDNYHNPSSSNQNFTIPVAGYYVVKYQIHWDNSVDDSSRRAAHVYVNGASVATRNPMAAQGATDGTYMYVDWEGHLNAGDTVKCVVRHAVGATIQILQAETWGKIRKVG